MKDKIFSFNDKTSTLNVTLPQGHTMAELTEAALVEISAMIAGGDFYGRDIRINGRITTSMAIMLGHELSHVCKSVSIFDPKENTYVTCIKH